MSNHSKALAFINRLVKKFGKGGYIFRGTNTRYSLQKGEGGIRDGINSNLYRWVVKDDKEGEIPEEQENLKKIFSENEHFSPSDMEEEIVENARKHFPSNTENHEIITELQHFGGKTNMIDFSRNMYVALFFACQGNFNESGELIALREDDEKLNKIKEINYDKRPLKGALEVIDPAGAQNSRQRVHFQSSVFVRPANGYINPKECEKFRICRKIKKPLSEYLRVFHNLTKDSIYNDLHGFINNERNNETASLYFYMGLASQNKGDSKNAVVYYDKSIAKNPNMPNAYNNRGNAYGDLGEDILAIEDFNKALSFDLNDASAYNNRGIIHKKLHRYDLAIQDYAAAIALNPNYVTAYNNRGNAYSDSGQYELAIMDYSKAISLRPDYAGAYNNRAISYAHLKKYKHAIKDLDKAALLNPSNPEIYFNRGNAYSALGQCKQAIEDFDKAVSINPNYAEAYNNRGNAYNALRQYKRAIEDFDKAISINPNFAESYNNRGNAYSGLKQNDLAIKNYAKAISINPNYAEAYYNSAAAKTEKGDIEDAKADIARAIKRGLVFLPKK